VSPAVSGKKHSAGLRQPIAVLAITRPEGAVDEAQRIEPRQRPLDVRRIYLEGSRRATRRRQVAGRQPGVKSQDHELEGTELTVLGDFGSRQARLALELVGPEGEGRAPRDDSPCPQHLVGETPDVCRHQAVESTDHPAGDDDEDNDS